MTLGDTFFVNHPSAHVHLWVVAAGPTLRLEYVIFNFTTYWDGCDSTCVLQAGDHPFIKHLTCVAYSRGKLLPESLTTSKAHSFAWKTPVSPPVLLRIQQGAIGSRFTPGKLKPIVGQALGN